VRAGASGGGGSHGVRCAGAAAGTHKTKPPPLPPPAAPLAGIRALADRSTTRECRWTPEIKKQLKQSRLGVTTALVDAIAACPAAQRPSVLLSSSAVGYYGSSQTASFTGTWAQAAPVGS
jgi:hypothetical protein